MPTNRLLSLSVTIRNNSIEINLLEVEQKENFAFDKAQGEQSETDSAAGKIAGALQQKTSVLIQRRR